MDQKALIKQVDGSEISDWMDQESLNEWRARPEVPEWVNGSEGSDLRMKGSEISDLIGEWIRRLWLNEGMH